MVKITQKNNSSLSSTLFCSQHADKKSPSHLSASEISPLSLRDIMGVSANTGFSPHIIHLFIVVFHYRFFTIHFGGYFSPYFLGSTPMPYQTKKPGVNVSQLPFWHSNDITTIPVLEVRCFEKNAWVGFL